MTRSKPHDVIGDLTHDRHLSRGKVQQPTKLKKQGGGGHNWGSYEDQVDEAAVTSEQTEAGSSRKVEMISEKEFAEMQQAMNQ